MSFMSMNSSQLFSHWALLVTCLGKGCPDRGLCSCVPNSFLPVLHIRAAFLHPSLDLGPLAPCRNTKNMEDAALSIEVRLDPPPLLPFFPSAPQVS